jgi:hypothetical protein
MLPVSLDCPLIIDPITYIKTKLFHLIVVLPLGPEMCGRLQGTYF